MYALICVENSVHQSGDRVSSSRVTLMAANNGMAAVYLNFPVLNLCLISSEIARDSQETQGVVRWAGKVRAEFPLGQKKGKIVSLPLCF
ncbi:MAG: hypothetical protein EOO80_20175 [Oxalobacteraceae bacterium]|nr:MAG: hypothetical protein EOO80_20175 [Oxalobacteraceae bacterium]